MMLNKDPTESYHRQLQQTMQKCEDLIEKNRRKYLLNIKPTAPRINAYIKTHKENKPIRPVIDNTQAPSYKIAKFLNNRIKEYINLPNTYAVENSYKIAQELHKIHITENHKIVTLDIKDLYVNLPKQGIIQSTIFWLDRNNINKKIKEQIIQLLNIIIEQNYFQYNNQFFRPENGIAMGSPISGTLAEIYLQLIEELHIKHWIENQEIVYYKRYVDDILIIFDQHRTNETTITSFMNNINEQLDFKATREINKSINYLDLTINRSINKIEINIHRKPTNADITIQHTSNHPRDHKLAAFTYYINRMITLPITEKAKKHEWKNILNIAQKNGFPINIIHDIKKERNSQAKEQTDEIGGKANKTQTEQKMDNIHIP